jgi:hypothetical protein
LREVGNLGVWNLSGVGEFVGEGAEAGAKDEGDFGAERCFGKDELCGGFGAIEFGKRFLRRSLFARHGVMEFYME